MYLRYLIEQIDDPETKEIPIWLKDMIRERFMSNPVNEGNLEFNLSNLDRELDAYKVQFNNKSHTYERLRTSFGGRKKSTSIVTFPYLNFLSMYARNKLWEDICQERNEDPEELYYKINRIDRTKVNKQNKATSTTQKDEIADISAQVASIQNQLNTLSSDGAHERDCISEQLGDILKRLDKIDDEEQNRPTIEQHFVNQIHITQNNVYQIIVDAENKFFFEYVDELFWASIQTDDIDERRKIALRYFTRIDVNYAAKAVANRLIIEPEDTIQVTWADGEKETMAIVQLLQYAKSENFSLIKILAGGGFGKSTYLWWIASKYYTAYHIYFVEKVGSNAIRNLLENLKVRVASKPIMIIIDDFAEKDSLQFIKTLKLFAENSNLPVLIVMAERSTRYHLGTEQKKQQDKIEQLFEDNSWVISYRIDSKKEEIFDRVYPLLLKPAQKVSAGILNNSRTIFINPRLESIAESIYQLILFLKGEGRTNYEFDWIDWNRLIEKEPIRFGPLSELFHLTVCLYQFGIQLPLAYLNEFYHSPDFSLKVIHAIGSFSKRSPLRLVTEGETSVILRNEYVAQWYLSDDEHRAAVNIFFEDFLNHLDRPEAMKIFLRLSRMVRTYEIKNSFLAGLLNPVNFVAKLERLFIDNKDFIEDEAVLMEYGLLMLQFDKAKAIKTFEVIVQGNQNKYALHQLAEWYANDEATYEKARDYYLKILDHDRNNINIHATVGLYILARRATRKNIDLQLDKQVNSFFSLDPKDIANELSPHSVAELVTLLILQRELDLAEAILSFQTKTIGETAKCHLMLARALPFNEHNIALKETHFKKALLINPKHHDYIIEYAIFNYRLGLFGEAQKVMKSAYKKDPYYEELLMHRYNERVYSLEKLYFDKLPSRDDANAFKDYLTEEFNRTKSMIPPKKNTPDETDKQKADRILKGILLLRTISYHALNRVPELYFRCQARIAACHTQNAKFEGWNNLTPSENLEAAEGIYDSLLAINNKDFEVNQNLCFNLKGIIDSATDETFKYRKLRKMLSQCNYILSINQNRKTPEFYRHRYYAKKGLGDYTGQLADAVRAFENCVIENYPTNRKHYFNAEYSIQINNFILAICNCYKFGQPATVDRKTLNLNDAIKKYYALKHWDSNFKYLEETRKRIEEIDVKAFKKYHIRRYRR